MNDQLYHHGIKGQKWGVRRYQNSDGSLTAKGQARYREGSSNNKKKEIIGKYNSVNRHKKLKVAACVTGVVVVSAAIGVAYTRNSHGKPAKAIKQAASNYYYNYRREHDSKEPPKWIYDSICFINPKFAEIQMMFGHEYGKD